MATSEKLWYTYINLRFINSTTHLSSIIYIKLWEYTRGYWAETFNANEVHFEFWR